MTRGISFNHSPTNIFIIQVKRIAEQRRIKEEEEEIDASVGAALIADPIFTDFSLNVTAEQPLGRGQLRFNLNSGEENRAAFGAVDTAPTVAATTPRPPTGGFTLDQLTTGATTAGRSLQLTGTASSFVQAERLLAGPTKATSGNKHKQALAGQRKNRRTTV